MRDRRTCPQCDGYDTERVDVQLDWAPDAIETTRICNECPTQYSLIFAPGEVHEVFDTDELEVVR